LLASAIAVMLMGALYVAVDVQLRHVQISRDVVEQSSLTRVLVGRISNDIRGTLAPQLPKSSGGGGSSSGGGNTSTSATGAVASATTTPSRSTTTSMSAPTGTSGASTAGATSSASTTSSGVTNTVVFNLGVQGDNTTLVLYVTRGPRELYGLIGGSPDAVASETVSDLRRISYWLVGDSGSAQGLARQEVKLVTSADYINNLPPDIPEDPTWKVIAPEVQSVMFRYWDGNTWQDTWDSTQPPADNSSTNPQGPPRAIEITVGLPVVGGGDGQNLKTYRHVIALPTANGALPSSTSGTSGSTGTSTTGQ
jgi:hypothetical protein